MKRKTKIISLCLMLALLFNAIAFAVSASDLSLARASVSDEAKASAEAVDYTQYVKLFNGTGGDHGQLSPSAQVPHGLVKLGADTWPKTSGTAQSGYNFNALLVRGFSHTRVEGTGNVGSGGDVRIMPSLTAPSAGFNPDLNSLYKVNEEATPGYYKTDLVPSEPAYVGTTPDERLAEKVSTDAATTITAEMTADIRTGYHKYTFPTDTAYFYIDLGDAFAGRPEGGAYIAIVGDNRLEGYVIGGNVTGRTTNFYKLYFAVEFDRAFTTVSLYDNSEALSANTSETGINVGAVVSFSEVSAPVYARVTMSPISIEQAWRDMANETEPYASLSDALAFEAARAEAKAAWQDILSRVKIEDSRTDAHTADLIEMAYTSVYRTFTMPMNATSTDGTYMGSDGQVHDANGTIHYDGWSLWDDYRKYPLIGLIAPEIYNDIIRSITSYHVDKYLNGRGEYWAVPNVGYESAITVLADGIAKGYWDDNMETVYEAMKSSSGRFSGTDHKTGYKSTTSEVVSDTLEYAYSDYCQALIAIALAAEMLERGDSERREYYVAEAEYYLEGAMLYRNLWLDNATTNTETGEGIGLFVPKDTSGNVVAYDPLEFAGYCYEGNLWHWRWSTPHDVKGAAALSGGAAKMLSDLTYFFDNNWFSAVNETDLQAPYIFNMIGAPSLTQKWVHNIYTESITQVFHNHGKYPSPVDIQVYQNKVEAFPHSMDEDTGTMSAMYLAAVLGLFPFAAGDGTYQIGSPAFERVTLDIGGGKTFTIKADGVSRDSFYIQSATLNGKAFERTWLDYSEISRGGELVFKMGAEPSDWAADAIQPISASDITSDIIEDGALLDPTYREPGAAAPGADSTEGGFTEPSDDDSMAYWSFDETVEAKDGSYPLTASKTPAYSDGKLGKALSLDGSTALTNDDASFAFGAGNFAVSLFVKPTSTANATIVAKEDTGLNTGWGIRIDGGHYQFNVIDNSTYRVTTTAAPTVGGWDHIVAVRDGGSVYLYVNGTLAGSKSNIGTRNLDSTQPLRIGARSNNGTVNLYFAGLVDELKIFNKAIDADKVAKLYSAAPAVDAAPAEKPDNAHFGFDKSLSDESGYYSFIGDGSYTEGRFKSALSLGGSVSYALPADALDFGASDFSASVWFKLDALPQSGSVIVGKEDSGANTGWSIRYNEGHIELNIRDNATYRIVSDVSPTVGEWYHAVAVRSGGSAYLYINGALAGSVDNLGEMNLSSAAAFRIGARTNNGAVDRYNKGAVDELIVYNTAIDAAEVARLYSAEPIEEDAAPAPTDYIAYWMLNGNLKDVTTRYDLLTDGAHSFTEGKDGFGKALNKLSATAADVYTDAEAFNFGTSSFTVSLWFTYDSAATTIISKEDYGTKKSGWSLRINSGMLQFNIPGSSGSRVQTPAPEANTWHHAVIGRNGGTAFMYLNGVLVGSNSSLGTYNLNSPNPLRIGARTTNGSPTQYLEGLVDDIKIYGRAVSAEEARSLYLDMPCTVIHSSKDGLTEDISASAAAGSVTDEIYFTLGSGEIWADGDYTFALVPEGEEIVWAEGDGAVKLYGVPDGLTPVFTRVDDHTLKMSLVGTATRDDGDYKYTLHLEFNPAYMLLDGATLASDVKILGGKLDIPVQFYAARLVWDGDTLTETVLGSGELSTVIEIDLMAEDAVSASEMLAFAPGAGGTLTVGKDIIISGLPEGITAVATVDESNPTKLYISFVGAAHDKHDVRNISVKLTASAFSDPTKVVYNVEKSGIVANFANLKLWYSANLLYESEAGDGSIEGEITVNLTDMEFADLAELPVSTEGLPEGLSVSVQRISATEAVVKISGRALAHGIDDAASFRLIFAPEAFVSQDTTYVQGVETDITLRFADAAVTLSAHGFRESARNDGSIYSPVVIGISDSTERFAGEVGEDFIASGKLTVSGIPAGLSAEAILLKNGMIRLQLLGASESHAPHDNVECLTLVFADEAFAEGDASAVSGSVLNGLTGPKILFTDVEGEDPEHTFANATCTEPKMCTECYKPVGEPLGHVYVDGICTVCGVNREGFVPGTVLKTENSFGSVADNSVAFHKSSGTVGETNYLKFYFDAPEGNTNTKVGYIQLSFGSSDVVIRNSGSYVKNTDYLVLDFDISTDGEMFDKLQFHARFKTATGSNAQNASSYPTLIGNNVRSLYVSDGTSNGGNEITAPNTDYNNAWRHISFVYDFSGNNPLGYVNYVYVDGEYAGSMEACLSSAVYLNFFRVSPNVLFSDIENGTNVKFANLTATRFGVGYDGMIDDIGVLANPAVSLYDIPELRYCVEDLPEGSIGEDVGKLAELTRGGVTENIYDILDLDASLREGDSVKLFANIGGSIIVPKGANITWDTNGYDMPKLLEYDYSEVHWVTRNMAGTVTASGGASSKDGRVLTDGLYASIVRAAGRCTVTLLNDYVLLGAGDSGSSVTSGKIAYYNMMTVFDLNGHTMSVELLSGTNVLSTDTSYVNNIRVKICDGKMIFKPGSSSSFMMMGHSAAIRLDNVDVDVNTSTFTDVRRGEMWLKDTNVTIKGGDLANMRSYHGVRSALVIDASTITVEKGSYAVDLNPLATGGGHTGMLNYVAVRNGSTLRSPSGYAFAATTLLPKTCTSASCRPENHLFISITDSVIEARDGVVSTTPSVAHEGTVLKTHLDIRDSEIKAAALTGLGAGASKSMSEYTHSVDVTVSGESKLDVELLARVSDMGALARVYVADGVLSMTDVEVGERTELYLESEASDIAYTSLGGEYGFVFTSNYERYAYKLGNLPTVTEFIWSAAEGDEVDMSRLATLNEGVSGIYHYEWSLADGVYTAVMVKDFAISSKTNLTLYDYFYYNLFIRADQYDAAKDHVTVLDPFGKAVAPEAETVKIGDVSYYKFQIKGISPDEATDAAVKVVMSIDGAYDDKWERSIELSIFDYAKSIIEKSADADSIRLMKAVLNYVAAAMEYNGSDASEVRAVIAGTKFDAPVEDKPEGTASDVAVAVRYEDSVSWVIAALEDTTVTVTYTQDGTERTVTKELTKGEEYEIKVKAYDFPSGIFVDSDKGEATVTVGSYYAALAGNGRAQTMLAAIYNYTLAATAYKK